MKSVDLDESGAHDQPACETFVRGPDAPRVRSYKAAKHLEWKV
jgi:hypothetical protein